ncbi:hypothetical protein K8R43_00020 [archaeon]|nr:hypothetical protein [archaeon]
MALPSFLIKDVIFPITDTVSGLKVSYYNKFLKKSQWWTHEKLQEYQNKRLRIIIKHAYETVPYYHQTMKKQKLKPENIKQPDDLKKLPILTKQNIRQHRQQLQSTKPGKYKQNATGGSTGEPLNYIVGYDSLSIGISAMYRAWHEAGYQFGDKIITIGGRSIVSGKKAFSKKAKDTLEGQHFLSAFSMNDKTMLKCVNEINKIKPTVIRGYACALNELAKYIEQENKEITYKPKGIVTTAEKLFPKQRQNIENAFGTKVFDNYGARDGNPNAFECKEHTGLHYSMELAIIESLKDNEPVQDEPGEFIVTDLHNHALPFIRYQVGDRGIMNGSCSCGRGLPLIKELSGRIQDFVETEDGTKIHGEFFSHIFWDTPGIEQFQIYQKKKGSIELRLVANKDFNEKQIEKVKTIITKNFPLEVKIKLVNKINKPSSSKYRIITKG